MAGVAEGRGDGCFEEEIVLEALPCCEISSDSGHRVRVVHVDEFEPPFHLGEGEGDAYLRRFATLFVDEGRVRRGGIGRVYRVTNALGEVYALKLLALSGQEPGELDEDYGRRREISEKAFRREYENHRALTGLKGLPRLYGFGRVDGVPALVMEWIEGYTVDRVRSMLSVDDEGRVSPLTAARLGRDIFDLLARMSSMGGGFAHRDISSRNVMVRTSRLPVERQAEEGVFDVCLIDFGSSLPVEQEDTSLTRSHAAPRGATPDYAAPEMLSDDPLRDASARATTRVDIYAAGTVLYELATGHLPFDLAFGEDESPYQVKTSKRPAECVLAHADGAAFAGVLVHEPEVAVIVDNAVHALGIDPDIEEVRDALAFVDVQLSSVIMACLEVDPKARPDASGVRDVFTSFVLRYAENVERSLAGEPLIPCQIDGAWRASVTSAFSGRNFLRTVGKSASAAIWAVVVVSAAILVNGAPASFDFASAHWEGNLSGVVVAAGLALPALVAFAVRGARVAEGVGFARGTTALAFSALAVFALGSCLDISPQSRETGLAAALFASVAASWCPLVVDFALAVVLPELKRRALMRGRDEDPAPSDAEGPSPLREAAVEGSLELPADCSNQSIKEDTR